MALQSSVVVQLKIRLISDCVTGGMPFGIQHFQTDRGREFFAEKAQKKFMKYGIKFRPNKPESPYLNGQVGHSQKTDKAEFYATANLNDPYLSGELVYWQRYYEWERPHSAHHGKPAIDKYIELIAQTPLTEEVLEAIVFSALVACSLYGLLLDRLLYTSCLLSYHPLAKAKALSWPCCPLADKIFDHSR